MEEFNPLDQNITPPEGNLLGWRGKGEKEIASGEKKREELLEELQLELREMFDGRMETSGVIRRVVANKDFQPASER